MVLVEGIHGYKGFIPLGYQVHTLISCIGYSQSKFKKVSGNDKVSTEFVFKEILRLYTIDKYMTYTILAMLRQ